MITRREFIKLTGYSFAGILLGGTLLSSCASYESYPNIIIIITDDQGYSDLGCYGSTLIDTPNIDKLAADGIRFTDFYSGAPMCSPSRASLLTGRYPPRTGITGVVSEDNQFGLPSGEFTIAEMLKGLGYSTACIGKWHLGHKPKYLPIRHGFDYYYGIPYSNDMSLDVTFDVSMKLSRNIKFNENMTPIRIFTDVPKKTWVPLMRNDEVIEYPTDQSTITKRYTEESKEFILESSQKGKPFFLYLSHNMPHIPIFRSREFMGRSKGGMYGDAVEEIDWSVGEIVNTLKTIGIDKNTMIIFTSDNGPWIERGNWGGNSPFRGGKFTIYEGGMRVPFIVNWPSSIPSGIVSSEICSSIDIFPSISQILGTQLPHDLYIDGIDISPLWLNPLSSKTPQRYLYYYGVGGFSAIRSGRWKLISPNRRSLYPIPLQLYDLFSDPGERNNVAGDYPEITKHLFIKLFDFRRSFA